MCRQIAILQASHAYLGEVIPSPAASPDIQTAAAQQQTMCIALAKKWGWDGKLGLTTPL